MKRFLIFCLVAVCLLGIPTTAFASNTEDFGENIALTVVYKDSGEAVSGASVMLYKIASVDRYFHVQADQTFSAFETDIENENADWYVLTDTLLQYIREENIPCDDETVVSHSGNAVFPTAGKVLDPGVYLLYSPKYKANSKVYYGSPVVMTLPNFFEDGQPTNQVTAKMKFTSRSLELTVVKCWDDKGYENKRPDKITVELLRNGKVVETRNLCKKECWTYTWKDLDPCDKWEVREKKVSGYLDPVYSCCEKNQARTITITNTYPRPYSPGSGGKTPQRLPQTGQLTWPIPVLAVSGMLLFALGWWLCFGNRKDRR